MAQNENLKVLNVAASTAGVVNAGILIMSLPIFITFPNLLLNG
jgi:hypothetical protein